MEKDHHFINIRHLAKEDPLLGLRLVEFSVTDLCNRKCVFCPHVDERVFPNSNVHIEQSIVENVIEDLVKHNFKGGIIFAGYGEPTLHKNICNLIKIASKHFPVQMFTNGDKIFDGNWYTLDDFIEAGLQSMYLAVYDDKEQLKRWMPTINKYKDQLIIDVFPAYELSPHGGIVFINRSGAVLNKKSLKTPCLLPHTKAYIDWDGELQLCSNDWMKKGGLGNVKQTPFSSLWKSKKLNRIRKELLIDRTRAGGPCTTCNENRMQTNPKIVNAIWTRFLESGLDGKAPDC